MNESSSSGSKAVMNAFSTRELGDSATLFGFLHNVVKVAIVPRFGSTAVRVFFLFLILQELLLFI